MNYLLPTISILLTSSLMPGLPNKRAEMYALSQEKNAYIPQYIISLIYISQCICILLKKLLRNSFSMNSTRCSPLQDEVQTSCAAGSTADKPAQRHSKSLIKLSTAHAMAIFIRDSPRSIRPGQPPCDSTASLWAAAQQA